MKGLLARVASILISGAICVMSPPGGLLLSPRRADANAGSAESVQRLSVPPATLERCPYDFGSPMPAATFCVYNGVALGPEGEMCADNVLVIWSSYALGALQQPQGGAGSAPTEVYLGFVADPELVLRAIVDPERSERAVMAGYTLGESQPSLPLLGETKLRAVGGGAQGDAGVLTIMLREPHNLRPAGCALAAYAGTFVGIVRLPLASEELVESNVQP
jgi:hypothetical protein